MRYLGVLAAVALVYGCDGGSDGKPTDPEVAQPASPSSPRAPATKAPVVPSEQEQPPVGELPVDDLDTLEVAQPGKAYGQVLVQAMSKESHLADLTFVRDEGVKARSGTVRYTAEPRVIVAAAQSALDESNLLGSGLSLDLDGDGETTSKVASKCESGTAILETTPPIRLEPVTALDDDVARFDYGPGAKRLVGNERAGAVLYAPCDAPKLALGVDPSAPLKLLEVASPAAFVVYRVKVDSADAEDPFTLESVEAGGKGVEYQLHPFREFAADGDEVAIYAAHLVVFPIDPAPPLQHVTVEIEGQQPEFITASINEVDAQGHRIRYADGFKPF